MSQDFHESLKALSEAWLADEATCVARLLPSATLGAEGRERALHHARLWVETIRREHKPNLSVTDVLSRFGLNSHEGLSLMCLAEALLRIPDRATADALIHDKLSDAEWRAAIGENAPTALNMAGWALAITGKVLDWRTSPITNPAEAAGHLVARVGQPVIREAIKAAMRWLADQFVTGETIAEALHRTQNMMKLGVRFSFDMLGEGARTAADAERYFNDYLRAIEAIGVFQNQYRFKNASGISVKLSALHTRYEMAQRERVLSEMVPRVISLCEVAARYGLPLTIDAEEADRLHLSLEIAQHLLAAPSLAAWTGLGFAVQAYQKRAPLVIETLVGAARAHRRRIHIRLVKGAYWDSEIKRAQERGLVDFPVFTRKASTDVSYLACARIMLAASEWIDPVFGTHNAMTVAHITECAGGMGQIEFQRLHGMGEEMHTLMLREGYRCCVYAPVGNHDVLLGYLVRRILENGANSSFVHQLLDPAVRFDDLLADPSDDVRNAGDVRHPRVTLPAHIFMPQRVNAVGINVADPFVTEPLLARIALCDWRRYPDQSPVTVDDACVTAHRAYAAWSRMEVSDRARILDKLAEKMEADAEKLYALLIHEAGKTLPDAVGEVREAVDFCRYYAAEARAVLAPVTLPSVTGEVNIVRLVGRGVFLCVSPWNFPLAIFVGQMVAALVTGNAVVAKPAPQTPRIALLIAEWLRVCGVPHEVVQVVTGGAEIGARLVDHPAVAGVAFTGSTSTARAINRALAAKEGGLVPFIAETGGQNALIVDSSALPEQVVDDVITSAFRSAGQRCSALRVLYLPQATADRVLAMLAGAMAELVVGDAALLSTDVARVIDHDAALRLTAHLDRLRQDPRCTLLARAERVSDGLPLLVPPQMWQIPSIAWLTGEVFGPILHVVRYAPHELSDVIAAINATGFGLTGGVHSRITSTVALAQRDLRVGNLYVNRSMIGAVVGSQPFGGMGLSGTGPKAGGAHYLPRFAVEQVTSVNTTAAGGNASLLAESGEA